VLDLTEVTELDLGAGRLLVGLATAMAAEGRALAIVAAPSADLLAGLPTERLEVFPDLDRATEWCEKRLLDTHGSGPAPQPRIGLAEQRLARGLDAAQLALLEEALVPLRFAEGERIFAVGDPADAAYLLLEGEVTLELDLGGTRRRLSTLTPGFSFGEFAFADASARPVSVRAETAGECLVFTLDAFERIGEENPGLQAALLRNLLSGYYEIIGRTTREVGSLLGGR
jgi:glutaminase